MNIKNLFLFVMMAGVCSIAHAADIRTALVRTVPGTQLAIDRGEQFEVPLRHNVDQNAQITNFGTHIDCKEIVTLIACLSSP